MKRPRVERDRLRERDRQARAQMSSTQCERGDSAPLFDAPVRVSPSPGDRVKQQIQSKLGVYEMVKHLLEEPKQLLGSDGAPPASPAPPAPAPPASAPPPKPRSSQEFKKPPTSHPIRPLHLQTPTLRGGFVKPAEGKPGHGGRGYYPGQPVKHSGSGEHRTNGYTHKGPPPPPQPQPSYNPRPSNKPSLPRLHIDNPLPRSSFGVSDFDSSLNEMQNKDYLSGQNEVENILKEMTDISTLVTGFAATPRKEVEPKYTFCNDVYQNTVVKPIMNFNSSPPKPESPPPSLSPPPATPQPQKQYRGSSNHGRNGLTRTGKSLTQPPLPSIQRNTASPDLKLDLILSDDSDEEPKISALVKPLGKPVPTPPTSSPVMEKTILSPAVSVPDAIRPMSDSTGAVTSSDDSCSDSSESDSSTSPPEPPTPLPEPPQTRWDLKSFLRPHRKPTPEPVVTQVDKNDDDSELEIVVVAHKKPDLLSSLSESDGEKKTKKYSRPKRRRRPISSSILISDDSSPSASPKPVKPETTTPDSGSGSESKPPKRESNIKKKASQAKSPPLMLSSNSEEEIIEKPDKKESVAKPSSKSTSKEPVSEPRKPKKKSNSKTPLSTSDSDAEDARKKKPVEGSDSEDEVWPVSPVNKRRPPSRRSGGKGSDGPVGRGVGSSERARRDQPWPKVSSSEDENNVAAGPVVKPTPRIPPTSGKRPPQGSSESDPEKEESPPKLDSEVPAIQDKKKSDTLRKLFSKQGNEFGGGKDGGKGGKGSIYSKGGKGEKAIVLVDSESERTSVQSPMKESPVCMTSPILNLNQRIPEAIPEGSSPFIKPNPVPNQEIKNGRLSIMCRLDLSRLSHIPSKRKSEEVRTRTELADTRQNKERKTETESKSDRSKERKSDRHRSHEDKLKKRKQSPAADVKEEELNHHSEVVKRLNPDVKPDHEPVSSGSTSAGQKRERRTSTSSSSSRDTSAKRHSALPTSKRKKHTERPSARSEGSLTDAPPTNHEREREKDKEESRDHKEEKDKVSVPQRIYYSYFEHPEEEFSDNDDKDQYLSEAKRLKHGADREKDHTAQGMQYLEAIMYFLLTGNTIEHESVTEKAAHTVYKTTLNLIKHISSKFCCHQNTSTQGSIDSKLAVLSLRCQSLLHFKLFKMRRSDVKECQKVVNEYMQKSNPPTPMEQYGSSVIQGQGTPSPLSPTPSPAGSVGSVGSQSSGYSSGELRGATSSSNTVNPGQTHHPPCIALPLPVHTALQKQNQHFDSLLASHELWEQADALVYKGKHKEFFIEIDRTCGPLTLHSCLRDLVRYVRVGIKRLKQLRSET